MKTNKTPNHSDNLNQSDKFTTYYQDILWNPTIAHGIENALYENAYEHQILGDILELDQSLTINN